MTRRGGTSLLVAVVAWLLMVSPALAALRAATITADPDTLTKDVTTNVDLTVTNVGSGGGGEEIGCVTVTIPGAFQIVSVSIVSLPSAKFDWTASTSGASGSAEMAKFQSKKERLKGGTAMQQGVFRIRVRGTSAGTFSWDARPYNDKNCSGGPFPAIAVPISVKPGATPPPTPAPTPRPTPPPTPRPTPTPAPTPRPTPAPTPRPTAKPAATATPGPTPAATSAPTATPRPSAVGTSTPAPQATTPAPSRSPSATPTFSVPPSTPAGGLPGSGGSAGGSGAPPSPGAPGPATSPAPRTWVLPVADETDPTPVDVPLDASLAGLGLSWVVPNLVLSVPGLLLVLVLGTQFASGALWLPIVRRRVGSFNVLGRRRRPVPGGGIRG